MTTTKSKTEMPTKVYLDSLNGNSRNRREMSTIFNDQDNDSDNIKLTNLDSFTLIRNPTLDNELANKKYFDGK